ncbi:MAG: 6-phosphofructokinase [Bacteroidetes bacterium]|nr:6-phosphofructokinase [Bacteroidota bacterium]MBU1484756.1 6-phosphofructokinase [Bacteroidota bacterium]MBU2046627.1 6-phosphofructokinase [Bacteroidota bacterium]MBU2269117.1 6-phosphofructokinase [Bacteroidota bacterium]MBU2376883.1 6-phosphofructokinase [Bacteroidota bacterium]
MNQIKRIGVFTSGGDAPGMNAAVRAVVRTALFYNLEVFGIRRGYEGMINGEFIPMDRKSVANIIQRGGTILKTARSMAFMTPEGRNEAYKQIKGVEIDALVAIGGDGTFTGAKIFGEEFNFPILGLPGTIDNDLFGTDFTIGYDTSINTVTEAIDKIRDTAESHDRLFIVEVMGRDCGLIALRSGIGVGAESIMIPETKTDLNALMHRLEISRKDKSSKILIVAEGEGDSGGAFEIAEKIKDKFPQYDTRVSVLGHIQRGGTPTCMDRVLASRLGVAAVEELIKGRKGEMVGLIHGQISFTPFDHAVKHHVEINQDLLKIVEILSL